MNMKFLKLKFIIPSILIIVMGIMIACFFIGALSATKLDTSADNIVFDEEGFEDIQAKVDNGEALNSARYVTDNEKYCMIIDENNTIITILEKDNNWSKTNYTSGKTVYTTAKFDGNNNEKSNIILQYFDSNNNPINLSAYEYSVNYSNKLTGEFLKYFKLRFVDNYVDVLYQIGNFLNINSLFPQYFDREVFEDLFIGNTLLLHTAFSKSTLAVEIENEDGSTAKGIKLEYSGIGMTFSAECAAYLEENGLATVTEAEGKGYWDLEDLATDGYLNLVWGKDLNSSTSPCEANPFIPAGLSSSTLVKTYYALQGKEEGSDVTYNTDFLTHTEESSPTYILQATSSQLSLLNAMMYPNPQKDGDLYSYYYSTAVQTKDRVLCYDYNQDGVYTEDEKILYGGFQKREVDESANKTWIYDENGRPVQDKLSVDVVNAQNESFGVADESKNVVFQVGVRFALEDKGLTVTMINDSIREGEGSDSEDPYFRHDEKICGIKINPYMTVNTSKEEDGQIILPDGSGSVISFNSEKVNQNVGMYSEKRIYGNDYTIPQAERGFESKKLMLPLYGFLETTKGQGVVAIVSKGAAQTGIEADFSRQSEGSYNYARFLTHLRETEKVKVSSGKEYNRDSRDLYTGDIEYRYIFLSGNDLDYVDVANVYRDYLIEKYNLTEKDTTKTNNVSINFLGAFTKKEIAFGFVYDAELSLTTFDEAAKIVKDLQGNGIEDMNVVYSNWTDDEGDAEITADIKASSALGGKKALKKLNEELKALNVQAYYDYNVTQGHGFDYAYGSLKYNTKSISSSYTSIATYVLSTGLADNTRKGGVLLSPKFYASLVSDYLNEVAKYEISGLALYDLGNSRISDYAKKNLIYAEDGNIYQSNALKTAYEGLNGNVLLSEPFDYAIPYTSYASGIPTDCTLYPIVDYSIPLYQLVISGLVDYSGEYINMDNDNNTVYNILKTIETGSNLSFMVSYSNTNVLLDTNYTNYYNAYYYNWRTDIIYMNKVLNDAGIYESRLVNHRYLTDNVVEVEYENGLTIIINYDDAVYQDASGLSVSSNWFAIMKEGE